MEAPRESRLVTVIGTTAVLAGLFFAFLSWVPRRTGLTFPVALALAYVPVGIGLILRRNWARHGAVAVAALMIGLIVSWLTPLLLRGAFILVANVPNVTQGHFWAWIRDLPFGRLAAGLTMALVAAVAVSGLGWSTWKLLSPEIRAEFVPSAAERKEWLGPRVRKAVGRFGWAWAALLALTFLAAVTSGLLERALTDRVRAVWDPGSRSIQLCESGKRYLLPADAAGRHLLFNPRIMTLGKKIRPSNADPLYIEFDSRLSERVKPPGYDGRFTPKQIHRVRGIHEPDLDCPPIAALESQR